MIREMKVMQAREALRQGAYDDPAILDESLDVMLDRQADLDDALEDAMDAIVQADFERHQATATAPFWADFEDTN